MDPQETLIEQAVQTTAAALGVPAHEVRLAVALNDSQRRAVDQWWEANDSDDFDCVDNYRFATKGNAAEEAAYDETRTLGCCGSVDVVLPCDDGTTLLFGFNYGH